MELPEGWTDDMSVDIPANKSIDELVQMIMKALLNFNDLDSLIKTICNDYNLSQEDADLALERIQGGIIRALTGNPVNKPDKIKDPMAWLAFQTVWKDLPKKSIFSKYPGKSAIRSAGSIPSSAAKPVKQLKPLATIILPSAP